MRKAVLCIGQLSPLSLTDTYQQKRWAEIQAAL